jgi:hypothetical protein
MALRLPGTENDIAVTRSTKYRLERISVPVLVVHGTADRMVPLAEHGGLLVDGAVPMSSEASRLESELALGVSGYDPAMDARTTLVLVKVVHTVAWAFLAACILAIPLAALAGRLRLAVLLSAIVLAEVALLALNSMRCPLTDVAARYTQSRSDNFDVYLPAWLARKNKRVFGALWVRARACLVLAPAEMVEKMTLCDSALG